MLLDLSKVRTAHERYEKVFPVDAFAGDQSDFRVIRPVALAFDLHKDKSQFRLVGSVQTELELPCSRCLEAFTIPVDADFDLRYQPLVPSTVKGDEEIADDDLTTAVYENDQIDLGQLMQEQFYLALPMKPLCNEACFGLCPICGINLNRGVCACTQAWEDPRLAVLKTLKKDS